MKTRTPAPRRSGPRPNLAQFPRETLAELRKVTWPSREETIRLTIMVIILSALVGLFLGAVDYAFSTFVTRFLIGV